MVTFLNGDEAGEADVGLTKKMILKQRPEKGKELVIDIWGKMIQREQEEKDFEAGVWLEHSRSSKDAKGSMAEQTRQW